MTAPRRAFVVSHTHWDREWYETFHTFRLRLDRVLEQVLEALEAGGEFRHFVLDGQALALEDVLEQRPELEPRLRRLTEAGRLSLGPWLILPDEFLVSGEATVRNLQLGHESAARFGGEQKVGYMPDSFGHLAQMPQILRRAGLDSFIYTRGNGDEIDELGWVYRWRAPDGSEVLAVNQCEGYCNAGGLGHDELWHAHTAREVRCERAVERVAELFEKKAAREGGDPFLLSNGCDHFPPQRDFDRVLAALREAWPETEFIHGSFRDFVDALGEGERKVFQGELLGGKLHPILSGVWSARMPLKQANDRCQRWLSGMAEPLAAYASLMHGRRWPGGELRYAWRKLLENHPHDSICGCSTDEVHREMGPRFMAVEQTARELTSLALGDLLPMFGRRAEEDRDTAIAVANALPRSRSRVMERLVVLQPLGYDFDRLRLHDEEGRAVPFRILERWTVERFWGVDYRSQIFIEDQLAQLHAYLDHFGPRILRPESEAGEADTFLHLQFLAEDLPALGHRLYFLREGDEKAPAADDPVRVEGATLENAQLRATLREDGGLDLLHKESGRLYRGLALLEDLADIGDEYDFGGLPVDAPVTLAGPGEIETLRDGLLRGRLRWTGALRLPRRLSADRASRVAETVDCPLAITVTLDTGASLLDLEVELDNRAEDHRLRMVFPTPHETGTLISDGAFMIHRRPLQQPAGEGWVQPPPGSFPQQDLSALQDDTGGLAVFAQGLPELAARREEGGTALELTLLRSVGWLSRDDFDERRRMNAGPTVFTPEAQCLGRQRFRLALAPYAGDVLEGGIPDLSQDWRFVPPQRQGVAAGSTPGASLFTASNGRVLTSAVRVHGERGTLILRLWNCGAEPERKVLEFRRPVAGAWRCDLLEERGEALGHDGETLELELGEHEIVTVEIQF